MPKRQRHLPCGGTPFTEVSKVLKEAMTWDWPGAEDTVVQLAEALAYLFKRHKPPKCGVGSHDGPCTATCLIEGSGFDRSRFLKECGIPDGDSS